MHASPPRPHSAPRFLCCSYNDVQRAGYSRATAETCVFVISAFIHEWILAISFRFWYPALLLMFGGPGEHEHEHEHERADATPTIITTTTTR